MNEYRFKFGQYPELHKQKYEGASVEALFYDAYKGVHLSLVYLFDFYFRFENKLDENVTVPIREFILKRMELLVYGEITPNKLLKPLGGKSYKRLYPNNDRSKLTSIVQDVKCWTKLSNEKSLEVVNSTFWKHKPKVCFKAFEVSFKAFEADKTILNKRKKRLQEVERLLRKFYTKKDCEKIDRAEIKHYVDATHLGQHQLDTKKKLDTIYVRANTLP